MQHSRGGEERQADCKFIRAVNMKIAERRSNLRNTEAGKFFAVYLHGKTWLIIIILVVMVITMMIMIITTVAMIIYSLALLLSLLLKDARKSLRQTIIS